MQLGKIENSWIDFDEVIKTIIHENKIVRVLEIGAGLNPYFDKSFIEKYNIEYQLLDPDYSKRDFRKDYLTTFSLDLPDPSIDLHNKANYSNILN